MLCRAPFLPWRHIATYAFLLISVSDAFLVSPGTLPSGTPFASKFPARQNRKLLPLAAGSVRRLGFLATEMSAPSPLKIRSVTSFIALSRDTFKEEGALESIFETAVRNNQRMQSMLEGRGFEVQTTRVATNSFEEWLSLTDDKSLNADLEKLSKVLTKEAVMFCSIGPAKTTVGLEKIPTILDLIAVVNSSCDLLPSRVLAQSDLQWYQAVADCCLQISRNSEGGAANFRFCAIANVDPGIPFFPAAYHASSAPPSFAIALENGGLAYEAFSKAAGGQIQDGMRGLLAAMDQACAGIEADALAVADETKFEFLGIDTSLNPALSDGGSIAYACEGLMGKGFKFGGAGTVALAEGMTRTVKSVKARQTGYCGLMLPVLEDAGLAARVSEGGLSVGSLLSFSSVCGVGLDTVPIAGDSSAEAIARVYADVAAMAVRLNKPLSCRLFPVPGVGAGQTADFPDNPYLCSSVALSVP